MLTELQADLGTRGADLFRRVPNRKLYGMRPQVFAGKHCIIIQRFVTIAL
jgi:hypothetical protein